MSTAIQQERWAQHLAHAPPTGHTLPSGFRDRILFDVSGCKHVCRALVEVENDNGVWGSEVCVDCGKQVEGPECPHVKCEWQMDGRLLVCLNCGVDAT